ncbi:MAG: hypothetical protein H7338_07245 [Candidatus Sericytochromatia bacterium]|nr:hypothetical protein [Candidatus Sericytochromatia bacterium]
MARYVVEWVCRSRDERDRALPFAVIAHDERGARLAPIDLPLDVVGRQVKVHPDSLRDHLTDWQDKITKPLHIYDRKSERYMSVVPSDPQWLTAACQPTLDENYYYTAIVEHDGHSDVVLDAVVAELQAQYGPQLVS